MYAFRDTPLPSFCKYICPAGTLEGGIGLLANKVNASYFSMLGPLFTWKFLLLVTIVVCCIFTFRMFCRFICPLGALYGFFNRFSIFGVKIDQSKCTNCNLCVSHCKMDVKCVGDHECISCGECIKVCPTKAIEWKGPNLLAGADNTQTNTSGKINIITRSLSLIVLAVIMIIAIVFYWNDDKRTATPPVSSEINEGNQIGDKCYGMELKVIDKSGITEQTINPAKTGKITIINFWGTWCSGCVKELPYFDQIASEYEENVDVIAIHTYMLYDTAYEFIDKYYPDSNMTFALDTEEEGYYAALGGRGAYPITVILDENGIVIKTFLEALEYEDLKEVVEGQLN